MNASLKKKKKKSPSWGRQSHTTAQKLPTQPRPAEVDGAGRGSAAGGAAAGATGREAGAVVAGGRVEVAGFRVSGSLRGWGGWVPREAAGSKGMLQLQKGIARQQRHGCVRNAELFVLLHIAGL